MDTMTNSEDPDEMPNKAGLHHSLYYFAKTKSIFRDRVFFYYKL